MAEKGWEVGVGVTRVCPVSPTLPLGREDQGGGSSHSPSHVEKKKVTPERDHSPEVNGEERSSDIFRRQEPAIN